MKLCYIGRHASWQINELESIPERRDPDGSVSPAIGGQARGINVSVSVRETQLRLATHLN